MWRSVAVLLLAALACQAVQLGPRVSRSNILDHLTKNINEPGQQLTKECIDKLLESRPKANDVVAVNLTKLCGHVLWVDTNVTYIITSENGARPGTCLFGVKAAEADWLALEETAINTTCDEQVISIKRGPNTIEYCGRGKKLGPILNKDMFMIVTIATKNEVAANRAIQLQFRGMPYYEKGDSLRKEQGQGQDQSRVRRSTGTNSMMLGGSKHTGKYNPRRETSRTYSCYDKRQETLPECIMLKENREIKLKIQSLKEELGPYAGKAVSDNQMEELKEQSNPYFNMVGLEQQNAALKKELVQLVKQTTLNEIQGKMLGKIDMNCNKVCGRVKGRSVRSSGPVRAKLGDYPWIGVVEIRARNRHTNSVREKSCTVTLVSSNYAITTAACLMEFPKENWVFEKLDATFGTINYYSSNDLSVTVPVEILLDFENGVDHIPELALVRLLEEIVITEEMFPVCVGDSKDFLDRSAKVMGFEQTSGILKESEITLKKDKHCNHMNDFEEGISICTEDRSLEVCKASLGDPLVVSRNNAWHQIGVASYEECDIQASVRPFLNITPYIKYLENFLSDSACVTTVP